MTRFRTYALLFAVLLLVPAVAGADEAPPAEGGDFLAELACNPTQSRAAADLEPTDPTFMTGCSAEITCFGGDVVSCTGNSSCIVDCGSVICDGQQTECTCNDACGTTAYCACRTCGGPRWRCILEWC